MTAAHHSIKHRIRKGEEHEYENDHPVHVCDLIAHETVSLLSVLDEDAVPPAQWMRDGFSLPGTLPVCQIEKDYTNAATGQLRTRFQAFVESLEIKRIQSEK